MTCEVHHAGTMRSMLWWQVVAKRSRAPRADRATAAGGSRAEMDVKQAAIQPFQALDRLEPLKFQRQLQE